MRFWLGTWFQTNAHSLARRAWFAGLKRTRAVFSKRQAVHFVTIGGQRYKRVTLGDSFEAVQVERALGRAGGEARFPPLIHRHENELLLGFVEGRRFDGNRPADRAELARFLGALYAAPRTDRSADDLQRKLRIDLDFLETAGLVAARLARALAERADSLRPAEIAYGLDYVDAVQKNFVMADDGLYAIDVESLRDETPIGTGLAKAALHWLPRAEVPEFVGDVDRSSGNALRDQYPYVELCLRVGWTKRKLLQGKHGSIRVELLEELLDSWHSPASEGRSD